LERKYRLDKYLVKIGLFPSREKAKEAIKNGEVYVKGYFVLCKVKKEGGKGTLKLELLKFGNSVSSDETTELDKFITVYSR